MVIYLVLLTQLVGIKSGRYNPVVSFVFLPVLGFVFSALAISRSGILTTGFLVIVSLFSLFSHSGGFKNISLALAFLILLTGVISSSQIDVIGSYFYKFDTKGLELAEREDVIDAYFNSITPFSFFFGPKNLDKISGDITLHNSYLHWHASYGFGSIVIIGYILVFMRRIVFAFPLIFWLTLVLLFRSFSDQILLSEGILMGLPLFMCLAWNDKKLISYSSTL